jgi:anti-sigma-K factor RskA
VNIKEYISSGIVESYVLGLADATERAEFESMCATNAEVKAARDNFEILLEQQAFTNVIVPPKDLESKIFAEIETETLKTSSRVVPFSTKINAGSDDEKIFSSIRSMRRVVAASVILLVASTILNFYFFSQNKDYHARYAKLLASQEQLTSSNKGLEAKLQTYRSDLAILKDPKMTIVKMPGTNVPTSPAPNSVATVFWNRDNKEVYLLISDMPQPVAGKQYQLWALVDGKPVDAGIFDTNSETAFVKMKNIPNAQGFAITLEKKGGSPSPTMEQMYVLGNVKT